MRGKGSGDSSRGRDLLGVANGLREDGGLGPLLTGENGLFVRVGGSVFLTALDWTTADLGGSALALDSFLYNLYFSAVIV